MPADPRLVADRYRLLAVVGRGGMGQVWEARDELLARTVAIKEVRFPSDVPDEERAQMGDRTMREARLTARLSHRGIVTIYDVVSVSGHPWIVMELVRAPSLADRIDADGPLPQRAVAKIGLQLLDALAMAHREGIVHRDVKPSNVLLAPDRVVLTDFGIATSESDATLTSTGLLIGSPTYMSPERLRGEGIGPAADMWSVGATLYAALEAGPPFRATTTMGTITAVLVDDPRPPRATGALREAVLGMLDKNVETRLTCSEAADLLKEAAEHLVGTAAVSPDTPVSPVHAPPVMAPVVTWERSEPAPEPPAASAPPPDGWSREDGLSILGPESSGSPDAPQPGEGGDGSSGGNGAEFVSWSADDGDSTPPRRRLGLVGALTALVAAALVALVVLFSQLAGGDTTAGSDETVTPTTNGPTRETPPEKKAKPTDTTRTREDKSPTRSTTTKSQPETKSTPKTTAPTTTPTTPTTTAPTTTTPTTTSPTKTQPTKTRPTQTASNAGSAPAGFDLVQDPLGFNVAVPEGWYRQLDGATRVDYVNPNNSGNYLRIDQIPEAGPDAYQAWVDYEQQLPNLFPGYELLRLERVDFRGWEAADLEWTYDGSSSTMRVLDRGFITDPRGFAILMSGPASTWESESRPVFDVAAATFEPTFTP